MFRHALVAVDFSPATDVLLDCLVDLQRLGVEEVTLVYVFSIRYPRGPEIEHEDHYRRRLESKKALLEAQGFGVSALMRVGYPSAEIIAAAHQRGASFILLGSHGYSLTREVALGSVASNVVHDSDLPVLLMKLEIAEDAQGRTCKLIAGDILSHVLHPTDFSTTAKRAFEYVEAMVAAGCRKVTLMHIQESSRIWPYLEHRLEEFTREDWSRLEDLGTRLRELGADEVNIEMPRGAPAREILESVRRASPSVVVMGSHGHGFVADIFAGSVSHNVVRHSSVPVLLVPHARLEVDKH